MYHDAMRTLAIELDDAQAAELAECLRAVQPLTAKLAVALQAAMLDPALLARDQLTAALTQLETVYGTLSGCPDGAPVTSQAIDQAISHIETALGTLPD